MANLILPAFAHEHEEEFLDDETVMDIHSDTKAGDKAKKIVEQGQAKYKTFVTQCIAAGVDIKYCEQLTRPNPESYADFTRTYGKNFKHILINPNESTWKNAFDGAKLVMLLEAKGVKIKYIYNWWRPEPYNANVGSSSPRHPAATAIDVRMTTVAEAKKALSFVCQWKKNGTIKMTSLGYYDYTGVHFGMGDVIDPSKGMGPEWGQPCEQ